MSYRKFTSDNIFTGHEMLNDGSVLVTNEKGKVLDIMKAGEAGEGIEKLDGIITPGFINCHCHLELSHLQGIVPPGTGIIKFLLTVMKNRNYPSEIISAAIIDAEISMIENGIVAVGDISNTRDTVLQKQKQNIYYHNFIEATGFVDSTANLRFGQSLDVYNKFPENKSVVPHSPYSVSANLFGLINKHAEGSLLTIHNQESHEENELFVNGSGDFLELYRTIGVDISGFKKTGMPSAQSYLNKISKDHSMILVHNTVTSKSDIDWILDNKVVLPELYWCICPNANLYISKMPILPDVLMLSRSGYKIVIGTDSLASNHQLNIIEELKTLQQYFSSLTITELLKWATANGAEALRISDNYGSFEKGKTPGIVLIKNVINGSLTSAFAKRILS